MLSTTVFRYKALYTHIAQVYKCLSELRMHSARLDFVQRWQLLRLRRGSRAGIQGRSNPIHFQIMRWRKSILRLIRQVTCIHSSSAPLSLDQSPSYAHRARRWEALSGMYLESKVKSFEIWCLRFEKLKYSTSSCRLLVRWGVVSSQQMCGFRLAFNIFEYFYACWRTNSIP